MNNYILTIDQGTTSTRTIIFDQKGSIISLSQREFSQICPHNGWVEHNPEEIWEMTLETIKAAINEKNIDVFDIKAIGITNQRETTVLWDKLTGKPLYNAIVWQSRQSQEICEKLINDGYTDLIKEKTGLLINPYFSGSKIRWLLDNVDGINQLIEEDRVLFGTIDTYLIWKLTDGLVHATDYSNASRTMIYNIHSLEWDEELLRILGIPKNILPKVLPSSHIYGYASNLSRLDEHFKNIPIASVIGDQQASLFGQCCFEEGDSKSTYGTGCFILMNTKEKIVTSENGLLTTSAWGLDGKVEYALEGSVFVGGSVIQWLRDQMQFFENSSDCEKYLQHKDPSNGVYLVPAFVGLGTPYWDNDARGSIFGLTRSSSRENIVAAALESIAFQVKDVMDVMEQEANSPIKYLGVDGGASVNNYLMQFQADILDVKLMRSKCKETTAIGAMYLAALAIGLYEKKEQIKKYHQVDKMFIKNMNDNIRNKKLSGCKKAVKATLEFK